MKLMIPQNKILIKNITSKMGLAFVFASFWWSFKNIFNIGTKIYNSGSNRMKPIKGINKESRTFNPVTLRNNRNKVEYFFGILMSNTLPEFGAIIKTKMDKKLRSSKNAQITQKNL